MTAHPRSKIITTQKSTIVTEDPGSTFTLDDFYMKAKSYTKIPVSIRAMKLEEPLRISTPEGVMRANVGDYLIRGIEGELYPCKDFIFEKTYTEDVPEENES